MSQNNAMPSDQEALELFVKSMVLERGILAERGPEVAAKEEELVLAALERSIKQHLWEQLSPEDQEAFQALLEAGDTAKSSRFLGEKLSPIEDHIKEAMLTFRTEYLSE